jgi:hypothetical protein
VNNFDHSESSVAHLNGKEHERFLMAVRYEPPTAAALLWLAASLFGALRQLDPFPGHSQPRFLVERTYRLLCLLKAFLGLLAESGCFDFGHGKADNPRNQTRPLRKSN